jgi:membrane-bound serine protease (ClpP class)
MGGFFLILARLVAKSHTLKPATGSEALIGQTGRARTALDPKGMVFVESALWEATSVDGPIPAGEAIEVVEMDGLRLRVRAATSLAGRPPEPGTGPDRSATPDAVAART